MSKYMIGELSERMFLISAAVQKYNEQYGKAYKPQNFDIRSIATRHNSDVSYEIKSNRLDDNLRLHLHLRFEGMDGMADYRVELDSNTTQDGTGNNSDEVFVALGTISPYYREQNIYKFRPLNNIIDVIPVLFKEDNTPLLKEDGTFIMTEKQV